jgi:hypothetical protein
MIRLTRTLTRSGPADCADEFLGDGARISIRGLNDDVLDRARRPALVQFTRLRQVPLGGGARADLSTATAEAFTLPERSGEDETLHSGNTEPGYEQAESI